MDLDWVIAMTGGKHGRRIERIQSLWSGYGEIVRVAVDDRTVIVKHVTPPESPENVVSHARKCRSYEVERAFYETYAARCDDSCRVPRHLASRFEDDEWTFVLEDLDAVGFVDRRHNATGPALERCVAWLASFHARFMGEAPIRLWPCGTYWHLDTRREELALAPPDLRALAPVLDEKLVSCKHQTILHGDAKMANFCFAPDAVAAVDFQYAGGGCGMKDVAYLLSGELGEARCLERYFEHLRRELGARGLDPAPIESEWRPLYPIACADFYRFLSGWSPPHYARDLHAQRLVSELATSLL